ncbi:hypothetical protein QE152_g39078 [Popillia japonica]|uniref:Uncharacterized protein n=1 Tax=Popillia japonica TaxID=7064 RepID=A0AAW1HUV8_POPJA
MRVASFEFSPGTPVDPGYVPPNTASLRSFVSSFQLPRRWLHLPETPATFRRTRRRYAPLCHPFNCRDGGSIFRNGIDIVLPSTQRVLEDVPVELCLFAERLAKITTRCQWRIEGVQKEALTRLVRIVMKELSS